MKCYYHGEEQATTSCKKCKLAICAECLDPEFKHYCYSCAFNYRNGSEEFHEDVPFEENNTSSKDLIRTIIASYQVFWGGIGIFLVLYNMKYDIYALGTITAVAILLSVGLLAFSVLAGILLMRKSKVGLTLSIVTQLLQVPQFLVQGLLYAFIVGGHVSIQYISIASYTSIRLDFGLVTSINNYSFAASDALFLGINIVPIVMLLFLLGLRRKGHALQID